MQSVDVLAGIDGVEDEALVQALRQGQLHEDSVDRLVGVEGGDQFQQLLLRDAAGKPVLARVDGDLPAARRFPLT